MRVNWNDINYPVDNWMIVVRQTNQEASDDDDDESTTAVIQVTIVNINSFFKAYLLNCSTTLVHLTFVWKQL